MTTNTIAVVTGGGSGIGAAVCETLSAGGYTVAVTDRDAQAARRVAEKLQAAGGNAFAVTADVSSTESVNQMIQQVATQCGRIDVLVNNAGTSSPGPAQEITDDDWETMVSIHLGGTFRCSRAAYPYLAESERAAIVNIASIAAHVGFPQRASYGSAKAGIEGLTRTLAVEWATDGIRVNAVAPGYTYTGLVREAIAKGIVDDATLASHIPLNRLAEPAELADAIAYLAGPNASFITGQILIVDGGMTINADYSLPRRQP